MYSNLTKGGAFPLVVRASSKPSSSSNLLISKGQAFPFGFHPKPSLNPSSVKFSTFSRDSMAASCKVPGFMGNGVGLRSIGARGPSGSTLMSGGFSALRVRSFCSSYAQRAGGRGESGSGRRRKSLVWLGSEGGEESRRVVKVGGARGARSSWGESAERLGKVNGGSSSRESEERFGNAGNAEASSKRIGEGFTRKGVKSSWGSLSGTVTRERGEWIKERRKRVIDVDEEDDEEDREEGESGAVPDRRWDRKEYRFQGMRGTGMKPDYQRWKKQENWGGTTGKEASESSVPQMIGEGIYGVGPVLAALSAGRRQFNTLYVQQGLDFSSNNRKKKDKKGFEKVLKMAEMIGLNTKEITKHDLNMVVDSRPHQGLVLDASPLEMVRITELDPVHAKEDKGSVWVALDEVTDPHNLGAIIRSAYFFGVSGVILCAKNSAPLSGVVSKASAGSLELMELRYCKNMMQFLVASAENGWRVLGGSVAPKAVPLNEISPGEPTILVLGSEGRGLRPLVERSCTQLVRIPGNIPLDATAAGTDYMEAEETNTEFSSREFGSFLAVESLNVSVAAGVLLHHLIGTSHIDNCRIGDH